MRYQRWSDGFHARQTHSRVGSFSWCPQEALAFRPLPIQKIGSWWPYAPRSEITGKPLLNAPSHGQSDPMTNVSAPLSTQRSDLLESPGPAACPRSGRDRRRSNRPGCGAGRCRAGVQRGAGGFHMISPGNVVARHQAGARGVRYLAQGNISWCARHCTSAPRCSATRPTWRNPGVRDALLSLLGDAVLWHRPHDGDAPQARPACIHPIPGA